MFALDIHVRRQTFAAETVLDHKPGLMFEGFDRCDLVIADNSNPLLVPAKITRPGDHPGKVVFFISEHIETHFRILRNER